MSSNTTQQQQQVRELLPLLTGRRPDVQRVRETLVRFLEAPATVGRHTVSFALLCAERVTKGEGRQ